MSCTCERDLDVRLKCTKSCHFHSAESNPQPLVMPACRVENPLFSANSFCANSQSITGGVPSGVSGFRGFWKTYKWFEPEEKCEQVQISENSTRFQIEQSALTMDTKKTKNNF